MKRRYMIIGSGAAGMTAAETLVQAGAGSELCVVSADPDGHYSRPGLAYYLAHEIDERQLFLTRPETWRRQGVEWIQAQVVGLDPARRTVQLQDGRTLDYERLLLAPGATASLPDLPGIQLEGVLKLDTLADTRRILKRARRGAEAVVVGGGITALELVEGLASCGMRVHYLLRGERYWSNVLDAEESQQVEDRLREEGVQVHKRTEVAEILGRREVEGVRTTAGQVLRCRLAAFAVGIRPRTELARAAGLAVKRGIQVNASLQTSDPAIFAAGDAAEVTDPASGESVLESLWNPAQQQSQVAAQNMLGAHRVYRRIAPINVTRLAGLVTTIIGQVGEARASPDRDLKGIMRGDSEIWRQASQAVVARSYSGDGRLRLFVGERSLRGAVLMGDQTISRPLQHLIENDVDISPIRDMLLEAGADLVGIIKEFDRQVLMTLAHHLEQPSK